MNNRDDDRRSGRSFQHGNDPRDQRGSGGNERGSRPGDRGWRGGEPNWRASERNRAGEHDFHGAEHNRGGERGWRGSEREDWQHRGQEGYRSSGGQRWEDDDRYRDRSRPQPQHRDYGDEWGRAAGHGPYGSGEDTFRQHASGGALPRGGTGEWNRGERGEWEEQNFGSHGERGYGTPQYGYGPSGYGASGSGAGYGNRDYRGGEGGYGASGYGGGRGFHGVGSYFGGNHGSYDANYGSDFGGPGAGQRGDMRREEQSPSERRSHRGVGPVGYSRSDDRIKEDVSDALTDHDDVDASQIEVSVKGGEVTLRGSVDARYMKRIAEDIAERVRGVRDVRNELRVKQESRGGTQNATRQNSTAGTSSSTATTPNANANGTRANS